MSNDSAFPKLEKLNSHGLNATGSVSEYGATSTGGLTKRQLLAAMMLQSNFITCAMINKTLGSMSDHVQDALDAADALLAATEKKG